MHLGVGQGGGAAAAVDGVRDAEFHGALERHGLNLAEHVVLELREDVVRPYEQLLWAHFRRDPRAATASELKASLDRCTCVIPNSS